MPLYTYRCTKCETEVDEFRSVAERDIAPECECGSKTRKILSLSKPIGDLNPYYDENLQGYVKSRQHRKDLMRERGVTEKFGKGWH